MSTRVLVFGTFDGLHPGHRYLLERAAEKGQLFVVVARDSNVRRIKSRAPVEPEQVRLANVQGAMPGATVLLGDAADFLAPVRMVGPDLIILGYDQRLPPGVAESDLACPIERLPAFEPEKYKSSLLRNKKKETGRS